MTETVFYVIRWQVEEYSSCHWNLKKFKLKNLNFREVVPSIKSTLDNFILTVSSSLLYKQKEYFNIQTKEQEKKNIFPRPSKKQCITVKYRFPRKKETKPEKVISSDIISTAKDFLGKLISHFTDSEKDGGCEWVKGIVWRFMVGHI